MGFRVSEMGQLKDRPLDNSMCTDPVQHQVVHFRKRYNFVQGPPALSHRDIPITTTVASRLREYRGILGHAQIGNPVLIEPE